MERKSNERRRTESREGEVNRYVVVVVVVVVVSTKLPGTISQC